MNEAHYYEVDVKWDANRKGTITSPVLNTPVEVATPPQFPHGMENIWSPEHLLVAAVNSCLMTTFLAIAENSRLEYISFHSNAKGKLEIVEGKYMISEITLAPRLEIHNEADRDRAFRILQKSEAACLISNSVRSKIIFQPEVALPVMAH